MIGPDVRGSGAGRRRPGPGRRRAGRSATPGPRPPAARQRRRRRPVGTSTAAAAGRAAAGSRPGPSTPRATAASSARAAVSRAAASGSRSAQRPTGGWSVGGRGRGGQVGDVELRGLLQGGEPVGGQAALRAAPEHRPRGEGVRRVGRGDGGVDDRGVREHPAGCDVALGGEPVAGLPERSDRRQQARFADLVDAGGAPPRLGARRRPARPCGRPRTPRAPIPACPARPAAAASTSRSSISTSTSKRRVDEPVLGKRAARPVGCPVSLLQRQPQHLLDERAEPDAGQPGQPAGELGVEEPRRGEPHLGEAGQVLVRGVQDPLRTGQRGGELREVAAQRDGVDERGAGAPRGAAARGRPAAST